jgi:hypothetical protein
MGFASWCEHCKRMKEKVFKELSVADYYNKHFICVKQDMEQGEGINLHRMFQVRSYPTFVFLDDNGNTLFQSTGEKTDSAMIELGKIALTPERQFPYLKKQFEADVANTENCLTYIIALRSAMLDCSEPARKHLDTQTDEQLLSALNWKIIANGIMDINSRYFQFILNHQKEYAMLASPLRVERKIVNVADELLTPYVNAKDSAGYFSWRPSVEAIHHPKVDSILFKYDLNIYERLNNWKEYERTAAIYVEIRAWNNGSLLKEIGNNYLNHVTDPNSLEQAAKWIKRAIELNDEYPQYLLCAKLYQKAGDKASAMGMTQKGIAVAEKYGWGHKDADTLLESLKK